MLRSDFEYIKSIKCRSYDLFKGSDHINLMLDKNLMSEDFEDNIFQEYKTILNKQKIFINSSFNLIKTNKHNSLSHSIYKDNCLIIDKIVDKPNENMFMNIIKNYKKQPEALNFVLPNSFNKIYQGENHNFIKRNIEFIEKSNISYISTPNNYGHFLEETIPSIGIFIDSLKSNKIPNIYFSSLKKFHKQMLLIFFPKIQYSELSLDINYKFTSSNFIPSLPSIHTIRWLDNFTTKFHKKINVNKKVLCGRRDRVKNFDEIKKYLLKNNYIFLDAFSDIEVIKETLSDAEVVVFTSGAEQANICFVNKDCRVFFLTSSLILKQKEFKNCYPNIYNRNKNIKLVFERNEDFKDGVTDYQEYMNNNPHFYEIDDLPI